MQEINYPSELTYFIAYVDENIFCYGIVEPQQCMATGEPNLYQTTNYYDWIEELKKFHVFQGYYFNNIEEAQNAKNSIEEFYGTNIRTLGDSINNGNVFYYILGNYVDILGESTLLKIPL
jgi:hypothetical protein